MAASGGRPGKAGGTDSDADLARRLDLLSRDLDAGRQERAAAVPAERSTGAGYAQAMRLATEFVAGILVGAALGWGLDRVAGTSPWGLIGFLLLGFCAGVLNVTRAAGRMTAADAKGRDGEGGPG
jgi:ATP synthase protein I